MEMVDSNQQKLSLPEIIEIAAMNTGYEGNPKDAVKAVTEELKKPDVEHIQFGNTLFIVQKMKDKVCIFRALNADVARNFVDNAARFVQWVYRKVKMDYGVTFFKGEAIHRLIKALYKIQPNKDVAYEIANMASGKKRAIVQFGPRRK